MSVSADPWGEIAGWAIAGWLVALLAIPFGARLLSSRVRLVRAVSAFIIGSLLGYVLLGAFVIRDEWHWFFGVIFLAITALSVLATLTTLEIVLGRSRPLRPIAWGKSVVERVRNIARYLHVMRIAAAHGLTGYLRGGEAPGVGPAVGRALADTLERAGTTFIKFGQVLAIRDDLLPSGIRSELARLHDRVAPAPAEVIRAIIEAELGGVGADLLSTLDDEPMAAASIAQVHGARLASGTALAVKVQRPDIEVQIHRDLIILNRLAYRLERRAAWARHARLTAFVDAFSRSLRDELDFSIEATNAMTVRSGMPDGPVRSVVILPELSTRRVLVMERVYGTPLSHRPAPSDDRRRGELADALLAEILREILDEGVFHADPHPGNVLLRPDDTLALIDFGSTGHLEPQTRDGLLAALLAVERRDAGLLADALLALSENSGTLDRESLERALRAYLQVHLRRHQALDVAAVHGMFLLASDHGLQLDPALGAVMRSLAVLEGTLLHLDPGYSLLDSAQRVVKRDRLGARSTRERLAADALGVLPMLRSLPGRLDRLFSDLETGRISVGTRVLAHQDDRRYVRGLVHLVLMTLLVIASGIMGVALLAVPGGADVIPGVQLFDVMGYAVLFAGSILLLRVLLVLARPERER